MTWVYGWSSQMGLQNWLFVVHKTTKKKSIFSKKFMRFIQGQKTTFDPEISKNLMLEKCEFCEKWDFENVNFVKNEILEM